MISFLTGKAYCDMSALVRGKIAERLLIDKQAKIVCIVPDQFEYETEKAMFDTLSARGISTEISRVRVVTFAHLSEEIIRQSGLDKQPADDIMKKIIMHKVIDIHKDRLTALRNICEKRGFVEKMLSTVSMLKTAGIDPELLCAENIEKGLSVPDVENSSRRIRRHSLIESKLCDVGILYAEYARELEKSYIDSLDFTATAAGIISEGNADCFDDTDVFVDKFNDFTQGQLYFLKEMFPYAENVTLAFNTDMRNSDPTRAGAFITINAQIKRLADYARTDEKCRGISVEITETEECTRKASPALAELSEKLFGIIPSECNADGAIEVVKSADIFAELDYAAAKIKELVLEKGYRYKEIAVLLADPGVYKGELESCFSRYEIPFFMDIHSSILNQPLINLITSLLNVVTSDFSINSVLSYVKTGFLQKKAENGEMTALTASDINAFEAYIYEWGATPEMLKKPFECADEEDKQSAVLKDRAEVTRNAVIPPLMKLRKRLSKQIDGAEITKEIYAFIKKEIGVERAIKARAAEIPEENRSDFTRSTQSLWNLLMNIMDSLHRGLKDVPIKLSDYADMFCDVCAGTSLAKPPQYIDTVLVGDIDRTRVGNVRAVFILGAVETALPSPVSADGIFSQFETEIIRENLLTIGDSAKKEYSLKSAKEQYALSQYRVFKALSLPDEFLALSYPAADIAGGENRRSEIADNVLSIFPDMEVTDTAEIPDAYFARTKKAARRLFSAGLYSNSAMHEALRQALISTDDGQFVETMEQLKQNRAADKTQSINPEKARLLFEKNISATKIEKLNLCRFKYFCENGLKIIEPVMRTFNPIFRGNAVHYCLEQVLKEYADDMNAFYALTRGQLHSLAKKHIESYGKLHFAKDFGDDKRAEYLFNNLAVITADIMIMLQREFYGRRYQPKFFELNLRENTSLPIIETKPADIAPPPASLFSDIGSEDIAQTEHSQQSGEKSLNVKPLQITLDDSKNVNITGIVDRVDMFTDSENGAQYLRVVDYKTNTRGFSLPKALSGINVQMLLYLFALSDANSKGENPVLPGGISYLPVKPGGLKDKRASAFAYLAGQHKQNGMLVADDKTYDEAREYADKLAESVLSEHAKAVEAAKQRGEEPPQLPDWLAKNAGKEDFFKAFMPDENSTLSEEGFREFREDCLGTIRSNLSELFSGNVTAKPVVYKENGEVSPCDYCSFGAICGKSECVIVDEKADISKYLRKEADEKSPRAKKDKEVKE